MKTARNFRSKGSILLLAAMLSCPVYLSARTSHPAQATHGDASYLLEAQVLRDATMAHAISGLLKQKPGTLVLHVNGKFHSEEFLGVPEQLRQYRPQARLLVITIASGEGYPEFDRARVGKLCDFIILTNPALPRSF